MAAPLSLLLLLLVSLAALLRPGAADSAPGPAAAGPVNITGILEKAGQYTYFIRLLNQTQAANQIDNQVNNSHDGMTVFAPTDNAFNNLPAGVLNDLTDQQQVQLVLYHICPKYYSLTDLQTVSNPVRTQASGQDGGVWGLFFSGASNQVNVSSSGNVTAPVNNYVRKDFPLAVYQLDRVLLPKEFYEAKPPAPAPPPARGNRSGSGGSGGGAVAPSTGNPAGNGAGRMDRVGMGLVGGFWVVLCMGIFA